MLLLVLLDTPTTDFWHDPLTLTILGIIATILIGTLGAVVAYWIYRRQRSKKEISFQIISDAPVISIDKTVAERVKITLDGNPLTTEARLAVISLQNSGNAAVRREDYDEPLVIKFNERTVVSWDILDTTPPDLKSYLKQLLQIPSTQPLSLPSAPQGLQSVDNSPQRTKTSLALRLNRIKRLILPMAHLSAPQSLPNFIELPIFLLNPGQSISLSVLLRGEKSEIELTGNIVDGRIIKYDPENQPVIIRVSLILGTLSFLSILIIPFLILLHITPPSSQPNSQSPDSFLVSLLVAVGTALATLATLVLLTSFTQIRKIRKQGLRIEW